MNVSRVRVLLDGADVSYLTASVVAEASVTEPLSVTLKMRASHVTVEDDGTVVYHLGATR